jgi:hypothetical protein
MPDHIPQSVRYVKNGSGSKWWPAAQAGGQIHFGWWFIPRELLRKHDLPAIKICIQDHYKNKGPATADFNAIKLVLENPSQHVWVTFEDGYLWWCTVRDGITVNDIKDSEKTNGSFWLKCDLPWSKHSIAEKLLARSELPGSVGVVAGFRATICEPKASAEILRVIQGQEDADAKAAAQARNAYTAAVEKLVKRLHPNDFELLIDLILIRTGWFRLAKRGGVIEGTDIEAGNVTTSETAFVQVKSQAGRRELDEYMEKYQARRDYFQRMIFAVHSPTKTLERPADLSIQVWTGERIAQLAVQLGLGEWIANRL